jgi:3-hydroxymyristoyl/3-hydroxydecanoyl-(acyl carrier protein) dehydratase
VRLKGTVTVDGQIAAEATIMCALTNRTAKKSTDGAASA